LVSSTVPEAAFPVIPGGTADLSNWGAHGFKVNARYTEGGTLDCGIRDSLDMVDVRFILNYAFDF
jgi:hypothetical protein